MINFTEEFIAQKAIETYRKITENYEAAKRLLETKKFHMGDYVIKNGASYFEGVFGVGDASLGKIVGYDTHYDYYRVYYNDQNNYIGVRETELELYEGEVPKHLKEYTFKIKSIRVDLEEGI